MVDCSAPTLGVCSLCSFHPLGLAHLLCGVGCWCRHCELTHQVVGADIVTEQNTSMLVPVGVGADIVTEQNTSMLVPVGVGADIVTEQNTSMLVPVGVGADIVTE